MFLQRLCQRVEKDMELDTLIKYKKSYGYSYKDSDGDECEAGIIVLDVKWGYNVYEKAKCIRWFAKLSDAIEWAVSRAQAKIDTRKNDEAKLDDEDEE
jgi:hypothetical protein